MQVESSVYAKSPPSTRPAQLLVTSCSAESAAVLLSFEVFTQDTQLLLLSLYERNDKLILQLQGWHRRAY